MFGNGEAESPRIVILNCYSWYNKGDAGIVLAMVDSLRRALPRPRISVFTLTPSVDQEAYAADEINVYEGIPNLTELRGSLAGKVVRAAIQLGLFAPALILAGLLTRLLRRPIGSKRMRTLFSADVVVSCGGGFLHDQHGIRNLFAHVIPLVAASLAGKRMVAYSQSIGPFSTRGGRLLARLALRSMEHVFVREELSLELLSALGLRNDATQVPDAAFALPAVASERVKDLQARARESAGGRPVVGLTVREWHFPGSDDSEKKFERYLDAVEGLIRSEDAFFVFLPQVIGPGNDDDRRISRRIVERVGNEERVAMIGDDLAPGEVKALISGCDFFVGTRFHSSIFALSSGIPTLVISYLPKADGIMAALGLSEWVVPIPDCTPDRLIAGLRGLREREQELRQRLTDAAVALGEDATWPSFWIATSLGVWPLGTRESRRETVSANEV